jgi:hypothetical protein
MITKKTAVKPAAPKKRTKLQEAEYQNMLMREALYMAYDDYDEMFSVLQYILKDLDSESFSKYQVRNSLKAIRTLMIHNQYTMMDCAGLEY